MSAMYMNHSDITTLNIKGSDYQRIIAVNAVLLAALAKMRP